VTGQERREILANMIEPGRIQFSEPLPGDAKAIFHLLDKAGLEGMVSKRRDSKYLSGLSTNWAEGKTVDEYELLGVEPDLLAAHGAVSEPVAQAMADGALSRFGADTAIAVTGIAGPGGGTDDKPVGTVCFTVKLAGGETFTRTVRLPGDRADIRERSTTVAMHMLRRALSGQ